MTFSASHRRVIWFVIVSLPILSFCREPTFFISPRIWAEEGTVHIQSALVNGLWESLTIPHLGYYSAFNNFTVAIGLALFGIDGVAYVTTYFSFVIMLITVSAPLFLKSPYWGSDTNKISLAAYALVISSGEIWLNTVNAQFYFCLFTCFVLLSDTRCLKGWRLFCVLGMLLNGALTGITSVVLTPFFFFKIVKNQEKNKVDELIFLVLMLGLFVQILAFLTLSIDGHVNRLSVSYLPNLPAGLLETFRTPFRGMQCWVQTIVAITFLCILIWMRPLLSTKALFPLITAIYLGCLFSIFSLGMGGGGRYGYPVAVMVFCFLIGAINESGKAIGRVIVAFSTLMFFAGVINFGDISMYYEPHWLKFSTTNMLQDPSGIRFLAVFPQVAGSNLHISVDQKSLERFR